MKKFTSTTPSTIITQTLNGVDYEVEVRKGRGFCDVLTVTDPEGRDASPEVVGQVQDQVNA